MTNEKERVVAVGYATKLSLIDNLLINEDEQNVC